MMGFAEDLNDYYSGINALGLLTAIVKLAEMVPKPGLTILRLKTRPQPSSSSINDGSSTCAEPCGCRLKTPDGRVTKARKQDEWLPPSEAQYRLLTSDKPSFVKECLHHRQERRRQ